MFPYDSDASSMKPKAYHYQDLFFATVIWKKKIFFWKGIGSHKEFCKIGFTQTSEAKWFSIVYQFKRLLINSKLLYRKKKNRNYMYCYESSGRLQTVNFLNLAYSILLFC